MFLGRHTNSTFSEFEVYDMKIRGAFWGWRKHSELKICWAKPWGLGRLGWNSLIPGGISRHKSSFGEPWVGRQGWKACAAPQREVEKDEIWEKKHRRLSHSRNLHFLLQELVRQQRRTMLWTPEVPSVHLRHSSDENEEEASGSRLVR